jgi:hypothetical protein
MGDELGETNIVANRWQEVLSPHPTFRAIGDNTFAAGSKSANHRVERSCEKQGQFFDNTSFSFIAF